MPVIAFSRPLAGKAARLGDPVRPKNSSKKARRVAAG
jgi:hypothetical protein